MDNLITQAPRDYKPKSFWERPEGVTGQIVAVSAIAAGGYVLYHALPMIIALLQNTLYAALLGVATVAVVYVISDRRFWRLGSYMYQSLMRKITQVFVEIDPIGIMQNYVVDLEKKLANMGARIASLSGMIRACQEEIKKNEGIKNTSLMMVREASKAGKTLVIAEESRQAGRMQEANVTYQDLLSKMQLLHTVLVKYQGISNFLIKDIRREIDVKKRRKQMTDAAYSAIKSAKSIINGDPDAKAMFDLANEYLANDYAMKIGEIEEFVRMSDSFVSTIDLQNGVYEANALKMIEEWERRGDSILLGADAKRLMIEGSYSDGGKGDGGNSPSNDPHNTQPKQWF
ncbi:MAG TPA: hypothetical protein VIF82_01885 [Burkholderiaceae bacterium]|jgi:hypothetical protein